MRQQLSYSGCESIDCGGVGATEAQSPRPARTLWRNVLDVLVGAPVRLHHYRHLHAEVIEDALNAYDCGPKRRDRS